MTLPLLILLAAVLPAAFGALLLLLALAAFCFNGWFGSGSVDVVSPPSPPPHHTKNVAPKQSNAFGLVDGSHGPLRTRSHENLLSSFRISKRDSPLKHGRKVASTWKEPFLWSDHPSLIADAAERGWPAFGFVYTPSAACPVSLTSLCICSSGSHHSRQEDQPKTSWEVGHGGSLEYMQQVWLNPGMGAKVGLVQALRTALPLPGPPLVSDSFPQKCYFEITILAEGCEHMQVLPSSEKEDAKLVSSYPLVYEKHVLSDMNAEKLTENQTMSPLTANVLRNLSSNHDSAKFYSKGLPLEKDAVKFQILAIGLASGRAPPFRLPGFDPGSVGFHSNGHVFLSGAACARQGSKFPAAIKHEWNNINAVIGCGFDPASRNVVFTLNGEVVHELNVLSDEFGYPLYPAVAANYDVTLLVNFGQNPFAYAPANAERVPDPSLHMSITRSTKNGYGIEDSGELFSIGRIDSQLFEAGFPYIDDLQHRHVLSEADSELFEIVLDARP